MRKHFQVLRRVARSAKDWKVYFVPLFFSKGVCAVVYGAGGTFQYLVHLYDSPAITFGS
jgi:hypothetical protein